ncbi:SDR family oxidoreductase [Streptomyces sp. NPDC051243]|uniref:SDR family oxidoreductase n=1 Tax=Streptomyces sp. NPDC051243 TaxID=3365646 RepID=UPI0037919F0D
MSTMRIAVAGATGNIGARTAAALERAGHEVVRISRSLGVDLSTGDGLDAALTGVDAVVDATSHEAADRDEAVAYFGTTTRNLLAAEERAGVRHHVLLSIVGIDRVEGNAHYAGKREQERLVAEGPVPWTIVPFTQFHDFAVTVTSWTEQDGVATIPPLLVQPIAPGDVADILAEIATGPAQRRYRDVAGPEPQDLVDMARRTNEARGHAVKLVPTWSSLLGAEMAGDVLLPGEGARIAPTTFDDWLAKRQ